MDQFWGLPEESKCILAIFFHTKKSQKNQMTSKANTINYINDS